MTEYLSVSDFAKKWKMSERGVRNYCCRRKIPGAVLRGKTWSIPSDAVRPDRINKKQRHPETLLDRLREEKSVHLCGGIYHKLQVDLTYHSNHIEGSRLTHDQTRYIYETNTVGLTDGAANADDIIETANHFRCIDMVIDNANRELSEHFIKELHRTLKSGTADSRVSRIRAGDFKKLPNELGGNRTTEPKDVEEEIGKLLGAYNAIMQPCMDDLLDFHVRFERIHPFQDGNGRIGRLILFKECLRLNICPFFIDEERKLRYYRGIDRWAEEKEYLRDTCLLMQDAFRTEMDHFGIPCSE